MKQKFYVTGMTCSACSAHVENAVKKVEGVSSVTVSLLTNGMTVAFDESVTDVDAIVKAVEKSGYGAGVLSDEPSVKPNVVRTKNSSETSQSSVGLVRLITSIVFCVVLMYVAMGHMVGLPLPSFLSGAENAVSFALAQLLLCLPVWYVNRSYYIVGFKRLFQRAPNMDTLIAVGSAASAVYGVVVTFVISSALGAGDLEKVTRLQHQLYFESSAMILALVDLGKYFEGRSKRRTGDVLSKLKKLAPENAILIVDGEEREVNSKQLKYGDVVAVKNGMSFPADGKIVFGSCFADESAISGESLPREKLLGETVIGGTVCVGGYAQVEVTSTGKDSTLYKIIELVEDASSSKAPIQRLADKISAVFVPIVMSISLITLIVWLCIDKSISTALDFAISVLVISCPCALGLATPVAIMVATGKGAENGVLIKNGEILEKLGSINCVVFDKTGTLTVGKPAVRNYVCNIDEKQFFAVIAGIESQSEHPLGKAVVDYAREKGIENVTVGDFSALVGRGVVATYDGDTYAIGNKRLMDEQSVGESVYSQQFEQFTAQALTCLIVSRNGEYVGMVGVGDEIKETSVEAVELLRSMNVKTVLLTGDNAASANAVARAVGVDECFADVLPSGKEQVVENLKGKYVVAMVGDGVNDAPALTRADAGFAVASGTDIAVDSADVILVKNDMRDVATAIKLSKHTTRNIKENLFWAFFYNALGIPLAAGALYFAPIFVKLNPMIAAAAMSLSSLFVVSNALRLKFFKPAKLPKNYVAPQNAIDQCDAQSCAVEQIKEEKDIKEATMKYELKIEGMMCSHCTGRVQKALQALANVTEVIVSLEDKNAVVCADAVIGKDVLKNTVEDQGYEVKEVTQL